MPTFSSTNIDLSGATASLRELAIPEGMRDLKSYACEFNPLMKLTLGANVTSVETYAMDLE
jgi:hypothetical protein